MGASDIQQQELSLPSADHLKERLVFSAFDGSLDGFRARKGVLITTSGFTKEAIEYVKMIGKSIVLIDGEELTRLMFEYDLGVTPVKHYVLKKLDHDYFEES